MTRLPRMTAAFTTRWISDSGRAGGIRTHEKNRGFAWRIIVLHMLAVSSLCSVKSYTDSKSRARLREQIMALRPCGTAPAFAPYQTYLERSTCCVPHPGHSDKARVSRQLNQATGSNASKRVRRPALNKSSHIVKIAFSTGSIIF